MNKELMIKAGFAKEIEAMENSFCPCCKQPVTMEEFGYDERAKSEFKISGICKICQDVIFSEPKE